MSLLSRAEGDAVPSKQLKNFPGNPLLSLGLSLGLSTGLLVGLLGYSPVASTQEQPPEFVWFTLENDFFVGDDAGYTNGTEIGFGKGPFSDFNQDNLPDWLHWLAKDLYVSTLKNKQRGVSHMFFQRIQTPENISSKKLIADDLPYAGLLAWQGTLYAWDGQVAEQLSLTLGAVGPLSFAEESQALMHGLLGAQEPNGWDNQIENELVFNVEAQRVQNLYRSDNRGCQFDVLGLYGASLGNLKSATQAGFALRWGSALQHSFPVFSLDANRKAYSLSASAGQDFIYFFVGGNLGLVFNNIFIEGNTFKNSHYAPLEPVQNQMSTGVVWKFGALAYVLQLSSMSSRTAFTAERDAFGAVSFTYRH
ncbi:MAG: lipid A 3-O-deacylase [Motiliproteus sp.]|jgi:lipid A 3-O-deacylase